MYKPLAVLQAAIFAFIPPGANIQKVSADIPEEPPSTRISAEVPQLSEIIIGESYAVQKENAARKEREEVDRAEAVSEARRNTPPVEVQVQDGGVFLPLELNKIEIKEKAHLLVVQKWGEAEWPSFDSIVTSESGWNPSAVNPSSGACGLPQALPCGKMGGMDVDNQLRWMVAYVEGRYGTPKKAWAFWSANRWY